MRREWLVSLVVTLVTVALVLGAVRLIAPQLLGGPKDLGLVRLDRSVPSFYGTVFGDEGVLAAEVGDGYQLLDPVLQKRPKNFAADAGGWGPNDALGFRNPAVPLYAELITLGDSQTYGNNAARAQNWPSVMRERLRATRPTLTHYDLSAGGWSAVQYLAMFRHARVLRPRIAVVAFYSGNDPLEAFQVAYGIDAWRDLRPDPALGEGDAPKVASPAPPSDQWQVAFRGGPSTVFTPELRLSSNDRDNRAVDAGWRIMADVVRRIAAEAKSDGVSLAVTVIPTKELVYAGRVAAERLDAPPAYRRLVALEARNIAELGEAVKAQGVRWIDVVAPLQSAASATGMIYPDDLNGHPIPAGYRVIGEAIAMALVDAVATLPVAGLYAVMAPNHKDFRLFIANAEGLWLVEDDRLLERNGWDPKARVPELDIKVAATIPIAGTLTEVDPRRFGPQSGRSTQ